MFFVVVWAQGGFLQSVLVRLESSISSVLVRLGSFISSVRVRLESGFHSVLVRLESGLQSVLVRLESVISLVPLVVVQSRAKVVGRTVFTCLLCGQDGQWAAGGSPSWHAAGSGRGAA